MKKLKDNFRKGFTLIEMMVALVIITLLIGGGVVYINNSNTLQKSQGAQEELISDLRLARNYAVTNQTPKNFDGILNYVKVTITDGGTKLNVLANENEGTYFSKQISSGVTINMTNELRFSVYEGKLVDIYMSPVGIGETPVFVTNVGMGMSYVKRVYVTTSGMVYGN